MPDDKLVEPEARRRIGEVLGEDARMKAALSKLGWNNEHDGQRLLRIVVQRIEVAKGAIRVQLQCRSGFSRAGAGGVERVRGSNPPKSRQDSITLPLLPTLLPQRYRVRR